RLAVGPSILLPLATGRGAACIGSGRDSAGDAELSRLSLGYSSLVLLTLTGSPVLRVRVRLRGLSSPDASSTATASSFFAAFLASSSPVSTILLTNSCFRSLSASGMPISLAISRSSDTSFAFNSLIFINYKYKYCKDLLFYTQKFIHRFPPRTF